MPIYEYRCENGHTFEVMQRMTDDPVASCQTCDAPVRRVFHPVAVHFKGSGFYNTDYGKAKRGAANAESSLLGRQERGQQELGRQELLVGQQVGVEVRVEVVLGLVGLAG